MTKHEKKVEEAIKTIRLKKHPYKWIAERMPMSVVHFSRIINGHKPMLARHLDKLKELKVI